MKTISLMEQICLRGMILTFIVHLIFGYYVQRLPSDASSITSMRNFASKNENIDGVESND